ncbi:MAG: hypothetical protein ACSHYB_13920 [Roseibacillus sp.]
MSYASLLFLSVPLILGLAFGWQLKGRIPSLSCEQATETQATNRSSSSSGTQTTSSPAPSIKSSDTTEDLLALPSTELYDRLAHWVFDASPSEIAAFYQGYRDREKRPRSVTDLLFIGWTKVDPEAAITATRETADFRRAYWAWACHDPAKALTTAIERNEGIGDTALGIGEFHPKWLAENIESIPPNSRYTAMQGLAKWPDTGTPQLSVPLLLENFRSIPEPTLLALARQNPAKALQLLKDYEQSGGHRAQSRDYLQQLLKAVAVHDPQLLAEITPLLKSPKEKNAAQPLRFNNLLNQDPEAARAMLDKTPRSWLKDELAITYANHLLTTDRQEAFDYALQFFGGELSTFTRRKTFDYPGGRSSSSSQLVPGANELISSLLEQNPESLLNTLIPNETSDQAPVTNAQREAFNTASKLWSQQDLTGFADWVISRKGTREYSDGAARMTKALTAQKELGLAMEWAETIPIDDGRRNYRAEQLYTTWVKSDPENAAAWRLSEDFSQDPDKFPLPEGYQERSPLSGSP